MIHTQIETSLSDYIDNPLSEEVGEAYRETIRQSLVLEKRLISASALVGILFGVLITGYAFQSGLNLDWLDAFFYTFAVVVGAFFLTVTALEHLFRDRCNWKFLIDGKPALLGISAHNFSETDINEDVANRMEDSRRLVDNIKKLGRKPYVFEARLISSMFISSAHNIRPGAEVCPQ